MDRCAHVVVPVSKAHVPCPHLEPMEPIVFYDIPNTTPGCAWSPNTWKTR